MTDNEREALRLVGVYTAGQYRLDVLTGPAKASCRAHIMSALAGAKVPQSKAGINALERAVYAILPVVGNCAARRVDAFAELMQLKHWTPIGSEP